MSLCCYTLGRQCLRKQGRDRREAACGKEDYAASLGSSISPSASHNVFTGFSFLAMAILSKLSGEYNILYRVL